MRGQTGSEGTIRLVLVGFQPLGALAFSRALREARTPSGCFPLGRSMSASVPLGVASGPRQVFVRGSEGGFPCQRLPNGLKVPLHLLGSLPND